MKKQLLSHGENTNFLSIQLEIPFDQIELLDKKHCWALACQSKKDWLNRENFEIVLITNIVQEKLKDKSFSLPLRGIPLSKFNSNVDFKSNIEFAYYRAILITPDDLFNKLSSVISNTISEEEESDLLYKTNKLLVNTENGLCIVKYLFKSKYNLKSIEPHVGIAMSDQEMTSFLFQDQVKYNPVIKMDHLLYLQDKSIVDSPIKDELETSNVFNKLEILNKIDIDSLKNTVYDI